ncbi:ATP-binding cassette, subfamily B, MsbA [Alteromonadaceae bacterium Bs31]|nr:ATP-binding cassette, subfamily B, MsbA [Alteromonadaceae bacterium Bs31]
MTSTPTAKQNLLLYKRLLGYAFKYRTFFIISIFGFLLFAGTEALMVQLTEFFLNNLEGKETERLTFLPSEWRTSLYFVPVAIVVLATFRGIGGYLGNFYMGRVGLSVVNDLRQAVFNHMVDLPQKYFDDKNSGELVSLIIYNIEQVTGSVTRASKILFQDGLSVIFLLGFLLYYDWKLTVIFTAVIPILAGLIYIASRYFRRVSRSIQRAVGKVTHIATESFQGIKLVKSYNGEKYEKSRFTDATDDNLRFGIKFERVGAAQTPVLHIVIACALAVLFLLVLLFWDDSSAAAVAYVTYAGMIAKPFRNLSTVNAIIQRGLAAAETIFDTLDMPQAKDSGTQELNNVKGTIAFNNISFYYQQDQHALSNLSLTIEPGQTVALVGPSGSGKSTIVNLMLRFYEPQQGSISIDGQDITGLTLKSLRKNIALVNQQTILFNDTVTANIAYGSDASEINQHQVEIAAKNAFANHFINEMENTYDTEVGEAGDKLSGGQRQRLAIARALYKNAPILILDEATSALDNESEKQIQSALEILKQGRTTLVIAHRLSTIENADKIVVLDRGKIVEQGTHKELLAKNGAYAGLYNSQYQS